MVAHRTSLIWLVFTLACLVSWSNGEWNFPGSSNGVKSTKRCLSLNIASSQRNLPLKRYGQASSISIDILTRRKDSEAGSWEKRSSSSQVLYNDKIRLSFRAFSQDFYLHLEPTENLVHPDGARVRYIGLDSVREETIFPHQVRAFQGVVMHQDHSAERMAEDRVGVKREIGPIGFGDGVMGRAAMWVRNKGILSNSALTKLRNLSTVCFMMMDLNQERSPSRVRSIGQEMITRFNCLSTITLLVKMVTQLCLVEYWIEAHQSFTVDLTSWARQKHEIEVSYYEEKQIQDAAQTVTNSTLRMPCFSQRTTMMHIASHPCLSLHLPWIQGSFLQGRYFQCFEAELLISFVILKQQ